jgi:hypothetical protein
MTRRSALSTAANAAAVALLLGAASRVSAQVNTNDFALSDEAGSTPSLFLIKSATTYEATNGGQPVNVPEAGWSSQSEIDGIAFDNYGSVESNYAGNLVGSYFGNTTNGGSLYVFPTNGSVSSATLIFGNGTNQIVNGSGHGSFTSLGLAVYSTEFGGSPAISPGNDLLAMQTYNLGETDVLEYNAASAGSASGVTIGSFAAQNGPANNGFTSGTSSAGGEGSITPTWLDESTVGTVTTGHLLGMDPYNGRLLLQTVTKTPTGVSISATPSLVATLPNYNANGSTPQTFTSQLVYNPQISPYVYALQADFIASAGEDETAIGVYTFNSATDSSFTLLNEFNLSSNNVALGSFEAGQLGAKELTMDSRGDLFYSTYAGGSVAFQGESIYELPNIGWNNTGWGYGSLGGSATLGYTYAGSGSVGLSGDLETNPAAESTANLLHFFIPSVAGSSFSDLTVGMGVPVLPPVALRWAGTASNSAPSDTSGTWDTGITSNWINSSNANTTWTENNAAEFGAGSISAPPVTVTIPSGVTHTVSVLTTYPGSPAYTITGGTLAMVGDNLGDGISDNIASFTIASNFTDGTSAIGAPITVANGETLALTGQVFATTVGTTTFGTLDFNGTGTVLLTNAANNQPGTDIASNTLPLTPSGGTFGMLGVASGSLIVGGGTVIFNGSGTLTQNLGFSGNGTVNVGTNTLAVTGQLYGSGGFTKTGSGTLIMDGIDAVATGTAIIAAANGPVEVAAGTLVDNEGTMAASTTGGNPTGITALGNTDVTVGGPAGAGTLVLTPSGETGTLAGGGGITGLLEINLDNNGALVVTGAGSQELRDGGYLEAVRQLSSSPSQTIVNTPSSSDSLTDATEVRQFSLYAGYLNFIGPSYATINKTGPGKLTLASGGYTSDEVFNGQWNVSGGQLQIGPELSSISPLHTTGVIPSGTVINSSSNVYIGGTGEPLNALGYSNLSNAPVGTYGAYGDPDEPNSITVSSGGILSIAVDATMADDNLDASAQSNPNITAGGVNPTPSYLRASVTLAGGSLGSTGSEVVSSGAAFPSVTSGTMTTSQAYSYNMPDGVPVSASVGGTFTVASVGSLTSTILVCDPNGSIGLEDPGVGTGDTGARNFSLVGGAAEYAFAIGAIQNGTTLTYSTNWDGNLTISPGSLLTGVGTHAGGVFTIDRTYSFNDAAYDNDGGGTVNVGTTGLVNVGTGTQAASITVLPGAGLVLNGIGVLSNGSLTSNGTANYDDSSLSGLPALSPGANSVAIVNNSITAGNTTTGGTITIPLTSGSGSFGFTVKGGTQIVGAITGTGDTGVAGGATLVTSSITQGTLQVDGNAIILPGGGTANSGSLSSLSIASAGQLDIGDHSMLVEYGSGTSPVGDLSFAQTARNYPAGSLQRYAQTGFNSEQWNGHGIVSSVAADDFQNGDQLLAVGIADENDIENVYPADNTTGDGGTGTWQGLKINDPNNVLIRMTYYGDGNDDGVVNKFDVAALGLGYSGLAGYIGWSDGDYTYAGYISKLDISLLGDAYTFQGAPLGNAVTAGQAQYLLALDPDMPAKTAAFFQAIAAGETPEPASLALLGAASVGLLGRRRRRRH